MIVMKIGDKVVVFPAALGDGLYHVGVIVDIELFLYTTYVTVQFYTPTPDCVQYVTLVNLDLLKKFDDFQIKPFQDVIF